MQYTKVFIPITDQDQQDIIAAYLAEGDFDAFENHPEGLVAFIPSQQFNNTFLNSVLSEFDVALLDIIIENIAQQNWNAVWESNFEPIYLNNKCSVRAPFHAPLNTEIELIIEPKMSFGTGHHATTSMMMEYMLELNFNNKTVLDFGSGTGILAILASKLNAMNITAIDNEEWAVENSKENCERNNVINVQAILGEKEKVFGSFDIVLANINRHIIIESADVILPCVKENGELLISGILNQDENEIKNLIETEGFKFISTRQKENWSAMHFIKQKKAS
jgi:ribosomal protein L11 methyltransferase